MSRDLRYDVMRVVAIILVVLQHAWSIPHLDTPEHGWLCYVYGALVSCGVPLFIMVSGALNLRPAVTDYSLFFRKRFTRVLVPFLLWSAVIYLLTALTGGYSEVHGWQDILQCYLPYLATNRINASHWFIHVLLMLYLLTPVLQRALAAGDARKTSGYIVAVTFVLALLAKLYPEMYLLRYTSGLLIYFGLYVAGFYLSQLDLPRAKCVLAGCAAFVVIYTGNVLQHCPAYLLYALSATALFVLMLGADSRPSGTNGESLLTAVSRYSFFIYLVHVPLVRAFYMLQSRYVPYDGLWIDWLLPVGVALVTVALTAALGWCAERIFGKTALYIGIAPNMPS